MRCAMCVEFRGGGRWGANQNRVTDRFLMDGISRDLIRLRPGSWNLPLRVGPALHSGRAFRYPLSRALSPASVSHAQNISPYFARTSAEPCGLKCFR